MPDFIKLPSERVEQLRRLSEKRNMPIADLIGEYVGQQIKANVIGPEIPTIDVQRDGDTVTIDFGDFKREFTLELAKAFALTVRLYATPKTARSYPALDREAADHLNAISQELRYMNLDTSGAEQHVGVSRRGTSIKIVGEGGQGERTLAPSIARELADIVRAVATA